MKKDLNPSAVATGTTPNAKGVVRPVRLEDGVLKQPYRLPTEAEWEYAMRAGKPAQKFAWGNDLKPGGKCMANIWQGKFPHENTEEDGFARLAPVASYPPNDWGLVDMSGNVWEWCADDWHDNYTGAPEDGSAWITENNNRSLLRGGSWYGNPGLCRSAFRSFFARRVSTYHYYGFRVVCGC